MLHHLPDEAAQRFPAHRRVFREFARVLKPGGILTISTCSQEQLRRGYWHYHFIRRPPTPSETATSPSTSSWKSSTTAVRPSGELRAHRRHGPRRVLFRPPRSLSKEWRDVDSVWSLVAEDRLNLVHSRIRKLKRGESWRLRGAQRRPAHPHRPGNRRFRIPQIDQRRPRKIAHTLRGVYNLSTASRALDSARPKQIGRGIRVGGVRARWHACLFSGTSNREVSRSNASAAGSPTSLTR